MIIYNMKLKGCGKKLLCPNLRYEGLTEIHQSIEPVFGHGPFPVKISKAKHLTLRVV
jgi:hypothetical protein